MKITTTPFGQVDGRPVELYTFKNNHGITVKITNYGGTITSLVMPDKNGLTTDIVCGYEKLDGYFSQEYKDNAPYFGCIIGRYAGRIKDARFIVDNKEFKVTTNNGPHHLHGGIKGFDKRVWDAETIDEAGSVGVKLTLISADGEENYPGNLKVKVIYRLNNDNELSVEYYAETDKATPVSLTNHTYFNLNGFQEKVLNHKARIIADKFLVPDETGVPLGEEQIIHGTVWDYNETRPISDAFAEEPKGFEHYYVFSKPLRSFEKVAEFTEEKSGRTMKVFSSEPGMLFYTGLYTSDNLQRETGTRFGQFKAFCCETSKYPNGPNIEGAPDSVLQPNEQYQSKTVFKLEW